MQLVASLVADPGVVSLISAWSHTFEEIDHELFSTVILLLSLIQEGLVSVTGESMCNKYWLIAGKSIIRFTNHLDMTITVDWDVKQQIKPNNLPSGF